MFTYIICAIIVSIILTSIAFVIIGKVEHPTRHINLNWAIFMITIILACVLTMVVIYHNQHDITPADMQASYEQGVEDGKSSATHTYPSNEEVEEWMSSTQEVVISTHEDGSDPTIHIIDKGGDEWILIADAIETNN